MSAKLFCASVVLLAVTGVSWKLRQPTKLSVQCLDVVVTSDSTNGPIYCQIDEQGNVTAGRSTPPSTTILR